MPKTLFFALFHSRHESRRRRRRRLNKKKKLPPFPIQKEERKHGGEGKKPVFPFPCNSAMGRRRRRREGLTEEEEEEEAPEGFAQQKRKRRRTRMWRTWQLTVLFMAAGKENRAGKEDTYFPLLLGGFFPH